MLRTTQFNNVLTLSLRTAHNALLLKRELIIICVRNPCVITFFALLSKCFVCIATYHAHICSFDLTNHSPTVYNNPHVIKDVHLFNKVRASRKLVHALSLYHPSEPIRVTMTGRSRKLVHVYLCIISRHRDTTKDSQRQNQRESEGQITFHNLNLLMFFRFFAGVRVCCQG